VLKFCAFDQIDTSLLNCVLSECGIARAVPIDFSGNVKKKEEEKMEKKKTKKSPLLSLTLMDGDEFMAMDYDECVSCF
jgi:hypothetical protein